MRRLPIAVLALALSLVVAACGDDSDDADDATTTTASTSGTDALPGERVETFPEEGAQLAVVGVPAGETLPVRSGPSADFDVVVELEPLATNVTATGHQRMVDGELWSEVTVDDDTGWAETAHLLQPGAVNDITATLFPAPADPPRAETMEELGDAVAALRASTEPPSDVVVVAGPTVSDLGEITVDVIGLGDDSIGGERLAIFADPDPGGEGFTVRSVEATVLCLRGVGESGACV
jgi:hypothetical protein